MRIILIGAGNHLHYSIDIIQKESKHQIIGLLDSTPEKQGKDLFGYEVIGKPDDLKDLIDKYNIEAGLVTIGDNWIRKCVSESIVKTLPNFQFVNAIHPTVSVGIDVKMGHGVIAMAGCIINPGSSIGNFTFFATGAQIEHDCTIEDYASVSAGSITGGHVKIGELAAVTLGVTIVDRVSIGKNSVIGSGALVTKSIPDNVLAYGSPAKIIRSRAAGERFLK